MKNAAQLGVLAQADDNSGKLWSELSSRIMGVRWKVNWFVLAVLIFLSILLYIMATSMSMNAGRSLSLKPLGHARSGRHIYPVWPTFKTKPSIQSVSTCFYCQCLLNDLTQQRPVPHI